MIDDFKSLEAADIPLKTITITIKELPGKRLSMESSEAFSALSDRIAKGENLVGADALAYHTLCFIVQMTKPIPPKPAIITPSKPRLVT